MEYPGHVNHYQRTPIVVDRNEEFFSAGKEGVMSSKEAAMCERRTHAVSRRGQWS